jgi:glutathione S-transferase
MTLAEALTAPFVLRVYALTRYGLLPQSVVEGLDKLPSFSKWAGEVVRQESVLYVWDEGPTIEGTRRKIESLKTK